MRIDDSKADAIRSATVAVILELRAAYLANGANALKHWQQLQDRVRMAARTSASVPDWITTMVRSLQLPGPTSSLSSAILALSEEVACIPDPEFLDLVESEYAYLFALARAEADDRRELRAANAALKEGAK